MYSRLIARAAVTPGIRHPLVQAYVRGTRREVVRAEDDYERLRQAWLELAEGEGNDVALAMVGVDMERANRRLQGLTGAPTVVSYGNSHGHERRASRFAEESA